jgi:hypothetical protein
MIMKLSHRSTLLFIGDSITEADRKPAGEASPWKAWLGLSRGYVLMISAWLTDESAKI